MKYGYLASFALDHLSSANITMTAEKLFKVLHLLGYLINNILRIIIKVVRLAQSVEYGSNSTKSLTRITDQVWQVSFPAASHWFFGCFSILDTTKTLRVELWHHRLGIRYKLHRYPQQQKNPIKRISVIYIDFITKLGYIIKRYSWQKKNLTVLHNNYCPK